MRPGTRDDTGRTGDGLECTEDGQATGSWTGHGENTVLHFAQSHTRPCVVLASFSIWPYPVGTFTLAPGG